MSTRGTTFGSPSGEPSTTTRPMSQQMCERLWTLPTNGKRRHPQAQLKNELQPKLNFACRSIEGISKHTGNLTEAGVCDARGDARCWRTRTLNEGWETWICIIPAIENVEELSAELYTTAVVNLRRDSSILPSRIMSESVFELVRSTGAVVAACRVEISVETIASANANRV